MTLLHQAAQKAVEAPALKQVLDALRLGRVACEWAGHHDEAATFGAAMEAARSLAALRQQPEPVAQKFWLWRNHVDGRPEYWAFDNPYPINLHHGDPQTLGEPCGYALFKPSRDGSHGRTEEQVLQAIARAQEPPELPPLSDEHRQLMKFYGVMTLRALVKAQAHHIEKLQAKLPPTPSLGPQRVREG